MGIVRLFRVFLGVAVLMLVLAAVACESEEQASVANTPTPAAATAEPVDAMDDGDSDAKSMDHDRHGADNERLTEEDLALAMGFLDAFLGMMKENEAPNVGVIGDAQDAGIWVNGVGAVSAPPDLVELDLGVSATAGTVSEARQSAAEAMTAIIAYLSESGVADADIRTRHISIQPQYDWQERIEEGIRRSERVLTGYQVSNTVRVLVRELDSAGDLLDGAVAAGGDLVRVNGVNFRIEDPSELQTQAREKAVEDAMARAAELAGNAGVTLGRLVYLSEVSGEPVFAERAFAALAQDSGASTPISPGEQEVRVTVRAVFDIE